MSIAIEVQMPILNGLKTFGKWIFYFPQYFQFTANKKAYTIFSMRYRVKLLKVKTNLKHFACLSWYQQN